MEAAIVDARRKTLEEVQTWGASLSIAAACGGSTGSGGSAVPPPASSDDTGSGFPGGFPGFNTSRGGGGGGTASNEGAFSPMCMTPTSATRPRVADPAPPAVAPQAATSHTAAAAAPGPDMSTLEARILAKIAAVCAPGGSAGGGTRGVLSQHPASGGVGGHAGTATKASSGLNSRSSSGGGGGTASDASLAGSRDQQVGGAHRGGVKEHHQMDSSTTVTKKPPVPSFHTQPQNQQMGLTGSVGGGGSVSGRRTSVFRI